MFESFKKNLPLPAYDQCLKASHIFNLLDSRGIIGVAERTGYINRIRELAKALDRLGLVPKNRHGRFSIRTLF